MDIKEIKELMEAASQTQYKFINIKHEGTEMTLSSEPIDRSNAVISSDIGRVSEPVAITRDSVHEDAKKVETSESASNTKIEQTDDDCYIVSSPLVGNFYSAPSPDADDFVKVGDHVNVGDTLCIVEAMKLMNEIESEVSGEIVAICAKNGDGIEYSQPLFKIKQG